MATKKAAAKKAAPKKAAAKSTAKKAPAGGVFSESDLKKIHAALKKAVGPALADRAIVKLQGGKAATPPPVNQGGGTSK